jgi:hypothetical protein
MIVSSYFKTFFQGFLTSRHEVPASRKDKSRATRIRCRAEAKMADFPSFVHTGATCMSYGETIVDSWAVIAILVACVAHTEPAI